MLLTESNINSNYVNRCFPLGNINRGKSLELGEIKLKEINLILDLVESGGVRELSRQQGMSPGKISKWVNSIEAKLGIPMFERTSRGLTVTPDAETILPSLRVMQKTFMDLKMGSRNTDLPKELTFATTSFFSTHVLPDLFANLRSDHPETRFRLIDIAPNQLMPVAMRGGFQIAVHIGDLDWPKTWVSEHIGEVTWKLYCRKGHPTSGSNQLAKILKYPFVYPFYWTPEGLKYGTDHCPLPIKDRIMGDLTATATSAVEVVIKSDQFGFLPDIVAGPALERGELELKTIRNWKPVSQPVYLSVKSDLITKKLFESCIERLRSYLTT